MYEGVILVTNVDLISPDLSVFALLEYVLLAEIAIPTDAPSVRVSLAREDRLLSNVVGPELEESSVFVLLKVLPPLFYHLYGGVLSVGDVLVGADEVSHVPGLVEVALGFPGDLLFALLCFEFDL